MPNFIFLPMPRSVMFAEGEVSLSAHSALWIADPTLAFAAETLRDAFRTYADTQIDFIAEPPAEGDGATAVHLLLDPHIANAEGYRLTIDQSGVRIAGQTPAGVYYGVCTLRQLLMQTADALPMVTCEDWPDYAARGVMIDISRDKVPTMDTLLMLVDLFASWKINQLQLYMEHTFAYPEHRIVWEQASPMTGEEIERLDAYCRERYIELVPNQNSLGHMERWLKHPPYRHLAEMPEGFDSPWGGRREPTTLDPIDPASLSLISGLYDTLLPHFSSHKFNIGGDEPWELGQGKSKAAYEERGGRVYLDYLLKLHALVTERQHTMQFWADIIVKYPALVPEIPSDVTALVWGYEATQPTEEDCALVAQAGRSFYVCPGTSSWNSLAGRTDNALQNLLTAARHGRKYGASGYLITDWGDNGHWQPLPISYLGFAYGAALAWSENHNRDLDIQGALSRFAFEDASGIMGQMAYELGNVYTLFGGGQPNGTLLAYTLDTPLAEIEHRIKVLGQWAGSSASLTSETLHAGINRIDAIMHSLEDAQMRRADAELIQREFQQVADLMKYSARRLLQHFHQQPHEAGGAELELLLTRQREIWLKRNRPGGLAESLGRFDKVRQEYPAG